MLFVYFIFTIQFGIKTKDGVFLSFANNKTNKDGSYFSTGSSREFALDFMEAGTNVIQLNDDIKSIDVTMNDTFVIRDPKTGNEEPISMQVFDNDRFVIIFHGLCLTYDRTANTFKFKSCGSNEDQKFENEILPSVNNSGVVEKRVEYGARSDWNPFKRAMGLIRNFLKGTSDNNASGLKEKRSSIKEGSSLIKEDSSSIKEESSSIKEGKPKVEFKGDEDSSSESSKAKVNAIKEEQSNFTEEGAYTPNESISGELLENNSKLIRTPSILRNMLDPTRERFDMRQKDPFAPVHLPGRHDPMKKENETMALKDLPKDLGMNSPPEKTTPKDALNPFKKPDKKKMGSQADNTKVLSVEDYFYSRKKGRKYECSNVPVPDSSDNPLDEAPPVHKTIFTRRSSGGIVSSSSNGHKAPGKIRPSFNMDPNRTTPQACTPTY